MACTVELTDSASLRGKVSYARDQTRPISTFLGLPYAETPVGSLRFQPPQPLTLWNGERSAVKYGPICHQDVSSSEKTYFPFPVPENMSEDCLFLNVWSPDLEPKVKLPVMVWIHGGSFVQGFSNYYDGTALATHNNVVVVSINYRLGILGFLYNEAAGIPGNMGLLDQLEALRWIQKFIHIFGGDPDNVTLFGESAGGISISSHVLSPLAKGLFHRAICQSGTMLYPSAAWTKQQASKYWLKRLKQQGLEDESPQGVKTFLRQLSAQQFADVITQSNHIIDGHFLPTDPKTMYEKGQLNPITLLLGFNATEGYGFVLPMLGKQGVKEVDQAVQFITKIVKQSFYRGQPNTSAIIDSIVKTYIEPLQTISQESLTRALVTLYGDILFAAPSVKVAQYHCKHTATYLYMYNYRLSLSQAAPWSVADHGAEVPLVIGEPFLDRFPDVWSDEDRAVSASVMKYWTNFAKFGNPNEHGMQPWPLFDSTSESYLTIGANHSTGQHYERQRVKLWNDIIPSILSGGKPKL